jgi:hypothetical protein
VRLAIKGREKGYCVLNRDSCYYQLITPVAPFIRELFINAVLKYVLKLVP